MANRLVVWENTFQLLPEAQEIVNERVDCGGFDEADIAKKETALIQAYRALCRLPFAVANIRAGEPFSVAELEDTPTERGALPQAFLACLRHAQVVHANYLLGGDSGSIEGQVRRKIEAGIVEERVGESTTRFAQIQSSTRRSSVVCWDALRELSGWVCYSVRLARA